MFLNCFISFNRRIGVVTPISLNLFLVYPFGDYTQKRVYEVFSAVGWPNKATPTRFACSVKRILILIYDV